MKYYEQKTSNYFTETRTEQVGGKEKNIRQVIRDFKSRLDEERYIKSRSVSRVVGHVEK